MKNTINIDINISITRVWLFVDISRYLSFQMSYSLFLIRFR